MEKLRGNWAISAALAAITAAVVGVIANLAVWFALNILFKEHWRLSAYGLDLLLPYLGSLNAPMLVVAGIAAILLFGCKFGILAVLGSCSALGMLWALIS